LELNEETVAGYRAQDKKTKSLLPITKGGQKPFRRHRGASRKQNCEQKAFCRSQEANKKSSTGIVVQAESLLPITEGGQKPFCWHCGASRKQKFTSTWASANSIPTLASTNSTPTWTSQGVGSLVFLSPSCREFSEINTI